MVVKEAFYAFVHVLCMLNGVWVVVVVVCLQSFAVYCQYYYDGILCGWHKILFPYWCIGLPICFIPLCNASCIDVRPT